MLSTAQLILIAQWLGIAAIAGAVVTVLAFLLQWGIRFRLVGVSSFTAVLAIGVYALSLSLYQRPVVAGAEKFVRVYDSAGGQAVISVAPNLTPEALEATLRQAALDLYSPGRTSPDGYMTIRARVLLHPQPGVTQPVYLGAVRRSLRSRETEDLQLQVDAETLAQLAS
jgi:Protein of function (DUF2518)